MTSDDRHSGKRIAIEAILAVVGVLTFCANTFLTYHANQAAQRASEATEKMAKIRQSELDTQGMVQYSVNLEGWNDSIVMSERHPEDQAASVGLALQNTGARTLRGCATYFEFVKDDLQPDIYWPIVWEWGGLVWKVDAGENHESKVEAVLPPADARQQVLIELWFECDNPELVSESVFIRVDRATNSVSMDDSLKRSIPLDVYDRYAAYERANGREPKPRP